MQGGGSPLPPLMRPTARALAQAKEFQIENEPRLNLKGKRLQYNLTRTGPEKIGELGVGIGLYFSGVRQLQYYFTFCALVGAALMGIHIWITSFDDVLRKDLFGPEVLMRTTTGSLHATYDLMGNITSSLIAPGKEDTVGDKRDFLFWIAIVDVVVTLLFVVVVRRMNRKAKAEADRIDKKTCTIDDYSILVYGIPPDFQEPLKLKEHFEGLRTMFRGKQVSMNVADVVIVKDIGEVLNLQKKRNAIAYKTLEAQAMMAKTGGAKGRDMYDNQLRRLREIDVPLTQKWKDGFRTVAAFVTFETEIAYFAAKQAYNFSWWTKGMQSDFLKFHYKGRELPLWIADARMPFDIIWENMHISPVNFFLRRLATSVFTLGLILACTSAIVAAKQYENSLPPMLDCGSSIESGVLPCKAMFPGVLNEIDAATTIDAREQLYDWRDGVQAEWCEGFVSKKTQIWTEDVKKFAPWGEDDWEEENPEVRQCSADACYGCFCKYYIGISGYISDASKSQDFCSQYWNDLSSAWAIKGVAIAVVIIINVGLGFLSRVITTWERHKTTSGLERAISLKLFIALFLNTSVSTILVYAHIPSIKFEIFFDGPAWADDFTLQWYRQVGVTLILTMLFQSLTPALYLQKLYLHGFKVKHQAKRKLTQRDLNNLFLGPKWELAERYGRLMALIFSTMLLSPALPIMWVIMAIFLFIDFSVNKYTLLRGSRTPVPYGEEITKMFARILPWAAWMHCAMAVWVYGALPAEGLDETAETVFKHPTEMENHAMNESSFGTKILKTPSFCMFFLWVIISFWLFFLRPLVSFLGNTAACLLLGTTRLTETPEGNPPFSVAISERILQGLDTYNILKNPEYREALAFFPNEAERWMLRELDMLDGLREDDLEDVEQSARSVPTLQKLRSRKLGSSKKHVNMVLDRKPVMEDGQTVEDTLIQAFEPPPQAYDDPPAAYDDPPVAEPGDAEDAGTPETPLPGQAGGTEAVEVEVPEEKAAESHPVEGEDGEGGEAEAEAEAEAEGEAEAKAEGEVPEEE